MKVVFIKKKKRIMENVILMIFLHVIILNIIYIVDSITNKPQGVKKNK